MAEYEAGRELDALVAERVMGWHLEDMSSYSFQGWYDGNGECTGWTETPDDYDSLRSFIGVWAPSVDIAAAWEVVEKIGNVPPKHSYCDGFRLSIGPDGLWEAGWTEFDHDMGRIFGPAHSVADTAPLAICRAALKARGDT